MQHKKDWNVQPMVKLLIIADDFTGALDTGVQFSASGAATRVVVSRGCDYEKTDSGVEVLVQDAETRHLSPGQAYDIIVEIARRAQKAGIPYLYKKTDSALRGNIGSELAAMLAGTKEQRLHFVPAFPKQGRTTIGGIHYVNGVPVAQSPFGKDPFEPVLVSDVSQIIAAQTPTAVHKVTLQAVAPHQGILLYDAVEDGDLTAIANCLEERGELHLLAGCAGFAAMLPALMGLSGHIPTLPSFDKGLLVACGSVNPITQQQIAAAAQQGFTHIRLTAHQKLKPGWPETQEGKETIKQWVKLCEAKEDVIIDTNELAEDLEELLPTGRNEAQAELSLEQLRTEVAKRIGCLVKKLLDSGVKKNLMITGGDTLLAFMQQIGCDVLEPICELSGGVVLSRLEYCGQTFQLISKSGGFGGEQLLTELSAKIQGMDFNGTQPQ